MSYTIWNWDVRIPKKTDRTYTSNSDNNHSSAFATWEGVFGNKAFVTVWPSDNYDYVTDWTADDVQLQAALDAINTAWWWTVCFVWELILSADVSVYSNTTLRGVWIGKSVLKRKDSNSTWQLDLSWVNNVKLIDFEYNGNKENQTVGISWIDIDSNCSNILCDSLYVHHCWESTDATQAMWLDFGSTDNIRVVNCRLTNNAHYGANFYECDFVIFANNISRDNVRHGVGSAWSNYMTVWNNILEDNWDQWVRFRNNSFLTITNNIIGRSSEQSSQVYGIQIKSWDTWWDLLADRTVIANNVIYWAKSTTNDSRGIYVQSWGTKNIEIKNNTIEWCDYGVYMTWGSYIDILGNKFTDSRQRDIYDIFGANVRIQNNYFNNFYKTSIETKGKYLDVCNNKFHSENLDANATYYGINYQDRTYVTIRNNTFDTLEWSNALAAWIYLAWSGVTNLICEYNIVKWTATVVSEAVGLGSTNVYVQNNYNMSSAGSYDINP